MKITKLGYVDDDGNPISIDLKESAVRWDSKKRCVSLAGLEITEPASRSAPRYMIEVSLEEVGKMVEVLGDTPVEECPDSLAAVLAPRLRALVRLADICTWPGSRPTTRE